MAVFGDDPFSDRPAAEDTPVQGEPGWGQSAWGDVGSWGQTHAGVRGQTKRPLKSIFMPNRAPEVDPDAVRGPEALSKGGGKAKQAGGNRMGLLYQLALMLGAGGGGRFRQ